MKKFDYFVIGFFFFPLLLPGCTQQKTKSVPDTDLVQAEVEQKTVIPREDKQRKNLSQPSTSTALHAKFLLDDFFHALINDCTVQDIQSFVKKGVDIKARDGLALHYAAKYNANIDVLKYLIEKGLDVNAKDRDGLRPLYIADTDEKKTILRAAGAHVWDDIFEAARNGTARDLKNFIKHGANVNEKDNEGNTPLHKAVSNSDAAAIMEYLVMQGADTNVKNKHGETPLDLKKRKEYEAQRETSRSYAKVQEREEQAQLPEWAKGRWKRAYTKLTSNEKQRIEQLDSLNEMWWKDEVFKSRVEESKGRVYLPNPSNSPFGEERNKILFEAELRP